MIVVADGSCQVAGTRIGMSPAKQRLFLQRTIDHRRGKLANRLWKLVGIKECVAEPKACFRQILSRNTVLVRQDRGEVLFRLSVVSAEKVSLAAMEVIPGFIY